MSVKLAMVDALKYAIIKLEPMYAVVIMDIHKTLITCGSA